MWADVAARGRSLTVITTFATGQPVLLTAPNQTSSTLINPLPNRVCNGRSDPLSSHIRNNGFLWFDPLVSLCRQSDFSATVDLQFSMAPAAIIGT